MIDHLITGLLRRERGALARAITLVESKLSFDRINADALLEAVRVQASSHNSLRIGVCGAPGVGKSTLVEALGSRLIEQGRRVAVLPIDPSSSFTGGSILGDKVRMPILAASENAFVRASPSKCQVGGMADTTVDAIALCEAAGFDTMFVETVGIGQSEIEIAQAVDVVLLVTAPWNGDQVQAMKKGILEVVDLVAMNKADGQLRSVAMNDRVAYAQGLGGKISVRCVSCRTQEGLTELLQEILAMHSQAVASGSLRAKRTRQTAYWMWAAFKSRLLEAADSDEEIIALRRALEQQIQEGSLLTSRKGASLLFSQFMLSRPTEK